MKLTTLKSLAAAFLALAVGNTWADTTVMDWSYNTSGNYGNADLWWYGGTHAVPATSDYMARFYHGSGQTITMDGNYAPAEVGVGCWWGNFSYTNSAGAFVPVTWKADDNTGHGLASSGMLNIAAGDKGTGALKIESGTYSFSGGWASRVADFEGAMAQLELAGGSLTFNNYPLIIAEGSNTKGTLIVTGGQLTCTGWLCVGANWGTTYTALMQVSGGTATVKESITIGSSGAEGSTATLEVSGGEVSTDGAIYVGERDTGSRTFTMKDGTVKATNGVLFGGNDSAAGTSTINLDGGILETKKIGYNSGTATSTINLNGGTIKATAAGEIIPANATYQTVKVGEKGITIDTQANDCSIAATLTSGVTGEGTTDGGLTKTGSGTLTFTEAPTFTGAYKVREGSIVLPSGTTGYTLSETKATVGDDGKITLEPDGENWTGNGSDTKFSTQANWDYPRATDSTAAVNFDGQADKTVTFDGAYTTAYATWIGSTTAGTYFDGTTAHPLVWTNSVENGGLSSTATNLLIANDDGQNGALKITGGVYSFVNVIDGVGTGIGYLELAGGSLSANNINLRGADGVLKVTGGTLNVDDTVWFGDNNVNNTFTFTGGTVNSAHNYGLGKLGTGTLTITDKALMRVYFDNGTIVAPVGCDFGRIDFAGNANTKIFKFDLSSKTFTDEAQSIQLMKISNYGDYTAADFGKDHVSLVSDQKILTTYTFDSDGYLCAAISLEPTYKTAWKQDFENADTYTENITYAAKKNELLKTVDVSGTGITWGNYSQATRANGSKCFLVAGSSKDLTGGVSYYRSYLFSVPAAQVTAMTQATSYTLEYDTVLVPMTTDGFAGVSINDSEKPLATLYVGVAGKSEGKELTATAYVYLGDTKDTTLGTFTTGTRSFDPLTTANAKYWLHIKIEGGSSGTYLTVSLADGTEVCTHKEVSDTNRIVTTLQGTFYNGSSNYGRYAAFDDVVVQTPYVGATYTWTGAAGNGLWSDPDNWAVDDATVYEAPGEKDIVTIPAGKSVQVDNSIAYKSVTLGEGSKLLVRFTAVGDTFKIPSGCESSVVAMGPFSTSINEGVMTVDSRVASTFTWSGGTAGIWSVAASWTVNGYPTLVLPDSSDSIAFATEGATITLTKDVVVTTVAVDAGTTFVGATIKCPTFSGTATITLGNDAKLKTLDAENETLTIANPIYVAAADDHPAQIFSWNNSKSGMVSDGGGNIKLNGKISGTGYLKLYAPRGSCTVSDISDFKGTLDIVGDGLQRNNTVLGGTPNAETIYKVVNDNRDYRTFMSDYSRNMTFGELSGAPQISQKVGGVYTLTVGGLGTSFSLGGKFYTASIASSACNGVKTQGYILKKVGDGTVTATAERFHAIEANGGVILANSDNLFLAKDLRDTTDYVIPFSFTGGSLTIGEAVTLDVSTNIVNSTKAIDVTVNNDLTWNAELAASNMGGLTKRGEGTLTLSTAPKYTGATCIEGGALVVNGDITLVAGSKITVADPAAKAGTVYLTATSITGTAALDSTSAVASQYHIVKSTDTAGNQVLKLEKIPPLMILVR